MADSNLDTAFRDALETYPNRGDRLRLYMKHLQNTIGVLENEMLEGERLTWSLLIYLLEIPAIKALEVDASISDLHKIAWHILQNDQLLFSHIIAKWTEDVYLFTNPDTQPKLSYEKTLQNAGTKIDPDAYYRGDGRLADTDLASQGQLITAAWHLIRGGDLPNATKYLSEGNDTYRATCLLGSLPYFSANDPIPDILIPSFMNTTDYQENTNGSHGFSVQMIGNSKWMLYLQSTLMLSNQAPREDLGPAGVHERAMFGSMCGNYDAMMGPWQGQYMNKLWASARSVFVAKLKSEFGIEDKSTGIKTMEDLLISGFDANKSYASFQQYIIDAMMQYSWDSFISALRNLPYASNVNYLRFIFHTQFALQEVITMEGYAEFFTDVNVRYLTYLLQSNQQYLLAYFLKNKSMPQDIASLLYTSLGRNQDPSRYFGILRSSEIQGTQEIICKHYIGMYDFVPLRTEVILQNAQETSDDVENILCIQDLWTDSLNLLERLIRNGRTQIAKPLYERLNQSRNPALNFYGDLLSSIKGYGAVNAAILEQRELEVTEEPDYTCGDLVDSAWHQRKSQEERFASKLAEAASSIDRCLRHEDLTNDWVELLVDWNKHIYSLSNRIS